MNLIVSKEWKDLSRHFENIKNIHLRELFEKNPARADTFTLKALGLYVDMSKNRVTEETIRLLLALANASGLQGAIDE